MSDGSLNIRLSKNAEFSYSTLGPEDRRRVDTWFGYLRSWRTDPDLRSQRSKRLDPVEELYSITTSTDYMIIFKIVGDDALILSILNKETLRAFEAAGRNAR